MNVLLNLQEGTLVRHSFTNNVFSCTIQRPKISYKNGRNDITLPWTYLFARGSISSMGKFMNTIMFMKYTAHSIVVCTRTFISCLGHQGRPVRFMNDKTNGPVRMDSHEPQEDAH